MRILKGTIRRTAILTVFVTLAACDAAPTGAPGSPGTASPPALSNVRRGRVPTIDEELARIARDEVPGFAGSYRGRNGERVVLLVAEPDLPEDRRALRKGAELRERWATARVERARFGFDELFAWREQLEREVPRPGQYAWDIEERNNRVFVGVTDRRFEEGVRETARRIGIPAAALDVQVMRMPTVRTALTDLVRPMNSGLRINVGEANDPCSLGAVVRISNAFYLATASHCDFGQMGTVTGAQMKQGGAVVGVEALDHPWTQYTNGCPMYQTCKYRYSDVAFYSLVGGQAVGYGYIARPVGPPGVGQPGSTTIDAANPRFEIIRGLSDALLEEDDELHKVGATTGWTKGNVLRRCFTVDPEQPLMPFKVQFRCMTETSIHSQGGDSGGPIFRLEANGTQVSLAGFLWGGAGPSSTVFSTLHGVLQDYGFIPLVTPGFAPPNHYQQLTVTGSGNVQPYASCLFVVGPYGENGTYEWSIDGTYFDSGAEVRVSRGSSYFLSVILRVNGSIVGGGGKQVEVSEYGDGCIDM